MSELTQLVIQLNKSQASEMLLPLVYDELRQLAAQKLATKSQDIPYSPPL